jgi:hypothetical protein
MCGVPRQCIRLFSSALRSEQSHQLSPRHCHYCCYHRPVVTNPPIIPFTPPFTQNCGLSVFGMDPSALTQARDLLCTVGLLHRSPSSEYVGVVHQLVQRCVRQLKLETSNVRKAAGSMLVARFQCGHRTSPDAWPSLRTLLPSVQIWCNTVEEPKSALDVSKTEIELHLRTGNFFNTCEINIGLGRVANEKAHTLAKTLLPRDSSMLAKVMHDLALVRQYEVQLLSFFYSTVSCH